MHSQVHPPSHDPRHRFGLYLTYSSYRRSLLPMAQLLPVPRWKFQISRHTHDVNPFHSSLFRLGDLKKWSSSQGYVLWRPQSQISENTRLNTHNLAACNV